MLKQYLYVFALSCLLISCSEDDPSFSILADTDTFVQSTSNFNNKLDILWVIDDSGSMAPYQTNLSNNFNAFINDFITLGYDFRMAVITSSAWVAEFSGTTANQNRARFRDQSGHGILTPSTPNIAQAFSQNISAGTTGNGDERPFQSIEVALEHSYNSSYDFPRADAYLAVIIVSDEDDYSNSTTTCLQPNPDGGCNYNFYNPATSHPSMVGYQVNDYYSYLSSLTNSQPNFEKFSVSTIAVLDNGCKSDPSTHSAAMIANRLMALSSLTEGVQGSICDSNFSTTLDLIQQTIGESSSQFCLSREPIPSTIKVSVGGISVPESSVNGWGYNATTNCIRFYGSALPPEGSAISVTFDPVGLDL